jgi:hypothetical protein
MRLCDCENVLRFPNTGWTSWTFGLAKVWVSKETGHRVATQNPE